MQTFSFSRTDSWLSRGKVRHTKHSFGVPFELVQFRFGLSARRSSNTTERAGETGYGLIPTRDFRADHVRGNARVRESVADQDLVAPQIHARKPLLQTLDDLPRA